MKSSTTILLATTTSLFASTVLAAPTPSPQLLGGSTGNTAVTACDATTPQMLCVLLDLEGLNVPGTCSTSAPYYVSSPVFSLLSFLWHQWISLLGENVKAIYRRKTWLTGSFSANSSLLATLGSRTLIDHGMIRGRTWMLTDGVGGLEELVTRTDYEKT